MWQQALSLKKNHIALIYRLLIIVFLFTCCRILFLLFNQQYFEPGGSAQVFWIFFAGLRFDLSVIFLINAPFIALSLFPFPFRIKRWYIVLTVSVFYIINALALLANCIDLAYFPYTLKRTGADIFGFISMGGGDDFLRLLPSYITDFWYITLIWSGLILVMVLLTNRSIFRNPSSGNRVVFYLKNTLYLAVGVAVWVVISRGGTQLRPLGIISAGEYTSAQNIPLVLNTPFTIIQTIGREQIVINKYYPDENKLAAQFSPVRQYHINPDSLKKKNVIIIILEGISKEQMGFGNGDLNGGGYKGYTPFLDSLAANGMNFTHAFANGKKSIEGIPAIIAGIPSMTESPYITSPYAGNQINALPSLLKPYGYQSAFYHGGTNGTMQFDAFAALAGFNKYYGRSEYNNEKDFDGHWGIWDEAFLQYTANKINELKQPFIASVFTLSSHHPYAIPEKYKGKFPKGTLEIHESIGYTDFALRKFFSTISRMDWYSNTLFVITSDHSSPTFSEYYQNSMGNLALPMIYFTPEGSLTGQRDEVTQQIDIFPSILDYLGYPRPFVAFGESVFRPESKHYNICYFNNVYQLIFNDLLIQFNGEKVLAIYNFKADPFLMNNLAGQQSEEIKASVQLVKAIVQSYNTRVKNNELTQRP